MRQALKASISAMILLFTSPSFAASIDLISLYQRAVNYDSDLFAAKSAYLAEKENETIAFASLLTSINGQANVGRTNSNNDLQADDSYKSINYSVSLTQPLVNLPNWHSLSSSEQNTLHAQTAYLSAGQDLIIDVTTAYFKVLREQENLKSARSQETAVKRQYELAKEQFDVGLIAITAVHEAKASYDSSQTSRIQSEGDLTIAIENLSRLTGEYAPELFTLKRDFPVMLETTNSSETWGVAALEHSLEIKTAEYALKTIEEQLKSSQSRHLPTLDLNAGYSNSKLTNFSPNSNVAEESSISLTLNVPLYSGGATQASIRQTRHQVEQAKYLLASTQRQVRIDARTGFINIKTNIQTIASLKQNIISRESALEATKEGYKVGTRNIVEVLDAERNYFTALRDYAIARFDFVESNLRLRRITGTLSVKDLEILNEWLEPVM